MKQLMILVLIAQSLASYAQVKTYSKMNKTERKEYLIKLAHEVVQKFGPEWYQEPMKTEIIGKKKFNAGNHPLPEVKNHNNREYYEVLLKKDVKNQPKYYFLAKVSIWVDTGKPMGVIFGHNWGVNFLQKAYEDWVEEGIKKENQIPYVPPKKYE